MNKIKKAIARVLFKDMFIPSVEDKTNGGPRELASNFVKRVVFKTNNDNDFEEPDFEMEDIEAAYDTDSYVRQGVDKYVDQLFKEGYTFYGKDSNVVDYLKLRLRYMAEATSIPTTQFLVEIAEDLVKYGNAMLVKSRNGDQNALPEGTNIAGLNGKDPIVGYFCANPSTMTCQRDDYGAITKWKQETDAGEVEFNPEDVVHFYYKRKRGNAYGTSLLVPILDDVRSLRQAEENVLKMMYRSIYPFHHVIVGTEEEPGRDSEVDKMVDVIDNMEIDGGVVTTERVQIKPIASDQVIDAEPYLRYMEQRVFSGFAIPDVLWGRGNCYDEETQTLTDNGWKYWYELTSTDKIATYNPENKHIEYHMPDSIIKHVSHYKGKMVHFKSKHIDIKVSPKHDMWVCTNGHKKGKMKWKKMKAIDLYTSGIKNFYFMEQTNGIQDFDIPVYIEIPYIKAKSTNGNNYITKFDTLFFTEFLGYFISEGSLNLAKYKEKKKYCISISQMKEPQLSKIINCIESLGLKYNLRYDKRDKTNCGEHCVEITIYHKSLWIYLKDNFGIYDINRHISREILNSSPKVLKVLLEALVDGDGTRDKREGRTSFSYYSISETLIDDVHEVCVKLGYKAKKILGKEECGNHNPVHRILISNSCNDYRYCTNEMITLEDYDGIMYCYNVPNHLFITRRNGKIAIQGNTANKSTSDNMASEMADRIRAIHRIIEAFFNEFIIKEILMEGGYDPVLNPDQAVELKFNDNDIDVMIKKEVHAIYKYEHNAITEDEMRLLIGTDPLEDSAREHMYQELVTRPNLYLQYGDKMAESKAAIEASKNQGQPAGNGGSKDTDNKQKNSGGNGQGNKKQKSGATKSSPNKSASKSGQDFRESAIQGVLKDSINELEDAVNIYIKDCQDKKVHVLQTKIQQITAAHVRSMCSIVEDSKEIQDCLIHGSAALLNGLYSDFISTSGNGFIDAVGIRMNLFRDSISECFRYFDTKT